MTTTLRPAGPETTTEGGGRSRAFAIHVNSRPVGSVRLTGPVPGRPPVGQVRELHVEPDERRRGRATVALLAAEEVLRGWGCAHIDAGVPLGPESADGPAPAERLLTALGYRHRSTHMVKQLHTAPDLPQGSSARPMSAAEFPAWWEKNAASFRAGLVERGLTEEQAQQVSAHTLRTQLPDGAAGRDAALRVLVHEGVDVGTLWIGYRALPRPDVDAWVYDVEVAEERRGRGHGRALMLLAERVCLDAGAGRLGLNVFADNPRARGLYTSLHYRTVEQHYAKRLG
ncbi:GNAT family N-acetyltransferase [Streptomyces cacaoi]|uniref:N-acetyltransferase n=1 Tax=Streptomyces cacaoi TaxID=1898 RepID=A0A4Y3QZR7_STRCI|nr:GNAT family N-acetyltransferase [Streptomyces cacaoi]NNG84111.1 GNAT family N-acetyltransferase [Streptomyces cacaoi]GEB50905.1 N-acetyltransferase [Streptomyces cacaoi]